LIASLAAVEEVAAVAEQRLERQEVVVVQAATAVLVAVAAGPLVAVQRVLAWKSLQRP